MAALAICASEDGSIARTVVHHSVVLDYCQALGIWSHGVSLHQHLVPFVSSIAAAFSFVPSVRERPASIAGLKDWRTVLRGSEKVDSVPLAIGAGWFGAYLAALDTRLDRHCSHVIYASAATSHTHASTKSLLDSAQYTESTTDRARICVVIRF